MSCKKWEVDYRGWGIPPHATGGRLVEFGSVANALEEISTSPRICCMTHKLDDAVEFLREYTNRFRDVSVLRYAAAAHITNTEASHVLSRLVEEDRAYRTGRGRYRYKLKLRAVN
jgi:hypothetical protein